MASNLACIGFHFAAGAQFQEAMLELAADAVERLGCPAGDYAIWRSRTGAEIWFHLVAFGEETDTRDIVGLTPFFEGHSEVRLQIAERIVRDDEDNAFEGRFRAVVLDGPNNAMQPAIVVVEAVDFAAHDRRAIPFDAAARLIGFAHTLVAISSAPAAGSGQALLESAIAPAATVGKLTRFSGRILQHHRHVNEVTGHDFIWMLIECAGVAVDVVAAPELLSGTIADGGYVEGTCVLFARLMD